MKSLYKISNLAIVAILVIGTIYSGYVLFNLTSSLEQVSGKIDLNAINEASSVFNNLYLVVGFTLIFGLVSSILLLYKLNSRTDQSIISTSEGQKSDSATKETVDKETVDFTKSIADLQSSAKGIKDTKAKYEKILAKLCMKLEASQGLFYQVKKDKNKRSIELMTSFAFNLPESNTIVYEFGEGLAGQVAKEGKKVNISEIPEGYITIVSGLGAASPNNLAIIPIFEGKDVAYIAEIASFKEISTSDEKIIAEALKLNTEEKKTKTTVASKKAGEKDKSIKSN